MILSGYASPSLTQAVTKSSWQIIQREYLIFTRMADDKNDDNQCWRQFVDWMHLKREITENKMYENEEDLST